MHLRLPAPIYEENILSLTHENNIIRFTYVDEERINRYSIVFASVYWFKFTDFEIMPMHDWTFGLELVEPENSEILNGRLKSILEKRGKYPQNNGLNQLKHYRLVVDDFGEIDIIANNLEMKTFSQQASNTAILE